MDDVEYEFRVTSVNRAGAGSPSTISNVVVAKDPIRESFTTCMLFLSVPLYIPLILNICLSFCRSSRPGEEPVCV